MSVRDYGMHDIDKVIGTPRVIGQVGASMTGHSQSLTDCPNCGCVLFAIEVDVEDKLLKGGKGSGRYLGCPACPYASQMVTTANSQ